MVDVKLLNQQCQKIFKPSEPKRSPRDVRYESATKKRRLNDIKALEPSIRVNIDKENHPVEAAELVVAWSGADVQDIYHDHSYCFVAENDETDPASRSNFKDGKPRPKKAQISRIFTSWVCFLATLFKKTLVLWPSKEEVEKNLPHSFKKYPNTRIIIDCTEVFIEKPTSPYAQRATWSEYKEHLGWNNLIWLL